MKFSELSIPGAFTIDIDPNVDERGLFARTFCVRELMERQLNSTIAQESVSFNCRRGTVRGLHYQSFPHGETKTIRCTAGSVYDVVVDLRADSRTFGSWEAVELSAANRRSLYIPPGFAHGFQTLADDTELLYQMSTEYVVESARGIRWNDTTLAIEWPIQTGITISSRDSSLPAFHAAVAERRS